jgi:hypothetical protein
VQISEGVSVRKLQDRDVQVRAWHGVEVLAYQLRELRLDVADEGCDVLRGPGGDSETVDVHGLEVCNRWFTGFLRIVLSQEVRNQCLIGLHGISIRCECRQISSHVCSAVRFVGFGDLLRIMAVGVVEKFLVPISSRRRTCCESWEVEGRHRVWR